MNEINVVQDEAEDLDVQASSKLPEVPLDVVCGVFPEGVDPMEFEECSLCSLIHAGLRPEGSCRNVTCHIARLNERNRGLIDLIMAKREVQNLRSGDILTFTGDDIDADTVQAVRKAVNGALPHVKDVLVFGLPKNLSCEVLTGQEKLTLVNRILDVPSKRESWAIQTEDTKFWDGVAKRRERWAGPLFKLSYRLWNWRLRRLSGWVLRRAVAVVRVGVVAQQKAADYRGQEYERIHTEREAAMKCTAEKKAEG